MKNKTRKILLMLGSATSIVAPIASVVACGNHTFVSRLNWDGQIDFSQSYSVTELQNEALDITNGKSWGERGVWKNGFLSSSQAISMLMNIAQRLGYNQKDSLEKSGNYVVIDENNVTSPTGDILNLLGNNLKDDNAKKMLEGNVDVLKNIVVNSSPISDFKKVSLLTPNQTIDQTDSIDTLGTLNLKYVDSNATPDAIKSIFAKSENKFNVLTWYDSQNPSDQIITLVGNKPVSGFGVVRSIVAHNQAGQYPIIDASKFKDQYLPYAKEALKDFMEKIGSSIEMMDLLEQLGMLPHTLVDLFHFFENKEIIDSQANVNIKDDIFDPILMDLNKSGVINWLAIKGFVLGYDDTFAQNGYEKWINHNWRDAIKANNDLPVGTIGVRDDSWSLTAPSGGATGLTPWMHWADNQQVFDPTLSIHDNYKLNGEKYNG